MTGPEHYAEAERILQRYVDGDSSEWPDVDCALDLGIAQVHATLALTAATAYPAIVAYTGDEMGAESRGWTNVTAPGRKAS